MNILNRKFTFLSIMAAILCLSCGKAFAADFLTLEDLAAKLEKRLSKTVIVDIQHQKKEVRVNLDLVLSHYGNLLTELYLHDFTAIIADDYIKIVGKKHARSSAIPVVTEGKKFYSHQFVSDVIQLNKACAPKVLPIIRPLVPQHSHLGAYEPSNSVFITDTYANTLRIRQLLSKIDNNIPDDLACSAKRER